MLTKENVSLFLWVGAAIFWGTSLQSHASQRIETYRSPYPTHCVGCQTTALVATLSAGPIWTATHKTQTFFLQSDIEKTYTATHNTGTNGTAELFLGAQSLLEEGLRGQFGLAIGVTGTSLKGHIYEDANPIFDDFTYAFNTKDIRYAVKAKFLMDVPCSLQAYLSGSLGVGVNRATNFRIYPIIPEAVPAPSFRDNTETNFAYTVGTGIERAIGEHFQVGIGYEFADWGKTILARAPGQTLNDGLGFSHLYTNELLFSITFIA